jgi:hypothetical protein
MNDSLALCDHCNYGAVAGGVLGDGGAIAACVDQGLLNIEGVTGFPGAIAVRRLRKLGLDQGQ